MSSAILRRQSDSESCGPETNVPLAFVLYHPDCTPRRSDSFVLTCRGERFCIEFTFKLGRSIAIKRETGRRVGMTASGLGGVLWRVARLPLEARLPACPACKKASRGCPLGSYGVSLVHEIRQMVTFNYSTEDENSPTDRVRTICPRRGRHCTTDSACERHPVLALV